ncbi:OmpP1/FadL family transporter [Thalassovita taeanensis]|uniref:Long-chain fatty acid transport protein n=1 Tax=Thalassovita taeanensis TaxID=657014 RepID=A0A1H8ZAA7_9RHOB|nr:outer membrane protein transport protein [Thalassovita taeanensis]SEP60538.1 long-chain fatty acid transport protein [Thalassovita taeanensis]
MKIINLRRHSVAGATMALGLMAALPAQATNGYFANGYGGGSKGMAGAGVAVPTGVLGLAQNPAMGMKVGNQAGFCLTMFAPDRGFSVSGAGGLTTGDFSSRNDLFAIPCGGVNFKLNERSSIGFFMFGNGGMNSEYDTNVFVPGYGVAGTSPLGVNLEQLFISANYSFEVNDQLTFGIAPVFALQRFSATGLENFAGYSSDPTALTNNGDDWSVGYGFNVGVLYEPSESWSIGAAYRSRMEMEAFDKYAGLFAEQGDFDVPAVATLGAAYTPQSDPRWTLTAEYQRIFYGDVAALGNTGTEITAPFGADDGPGFGWKDMDVLRIGAIYRASDKLTLRGGLSYSTQFIKNDEALLNILAPATPQWHVSIGASYKLNDRWGVTTSFTHAFDNEVTGTNPALAPTQPVTLRMSQNEFAIGMTYKW